MISPPPLRSERVRGIVFDLDGTLVDSYDAIRSSLNHARSSFGLEPLPLSEVRRRVGRGLEALMADLVGPEHVEAAVRIFREHYGKLFAQATSLLPGARETVRELRERGYRLAVASNKPAYFSGPILEHVGLRGDVSAVEGPDTAGAPKPEPAMLRACVRTLGLRLDEAAYVGDMVMDVETAARAGLPVVLVAGGSSDIEDLEKTGQTVLTSLRDLVELLPSRAEARTTHET